MTKVVNLNSFDEDDEEFQKFIGELKDDVVNAIFIVEHKDGSVRVGCNHSDRRDLVYAIYKLQGLAQSIANGGDE